VKALESLTEAICTFEESGGLEPPCQLMDSMELRGPDDAERASIQGQIKEKCDLEVGYARVE